MKLNRTSLIGVATTILVASVSGCSGSASEDKTQSNNETLRIVVTPVVDAAPLYLAQKNGIFKKHGLDVKLTVGQGATGVTEALQTGDADLAQMSYVNLFSARANGLPIKIASSITVSQAAEAGIYVGPDSSIKTVSDLKGKTFGTPAPGSIAELMVRAALDTADLSAKDYKLVQVPLPNLVAAVGSGQVDYSAVFSPFTLQAEQAGLVRIYDAFSGDTADFPAATIVGTEKWLNANKDVRESFRDALREATELANKDEAAVRALLPTYTALEANAAAKVSIPTFTADLSVDEIQRVPDLMTRYGMLKEQTDASTALDR